MPAFFGLLTLGTGEARADLTYVATRAGLFGTIETSTGAFTQIGQSSNVFRDYASLTFGPGGKLYALSDENNITLNTIDTVTGAVTLIGSTGLHDYLGVNDIVSYGLASTPDGSLFAYRGDTHSNTLLFQLDPATAAPTQIGGVGSLIQGGFQGDDSGNLYATGGNIGPPYPSGSGIYRIDPTTAAGTLIGQSSGGAGLALAFANHTMYSFATDGTIDRLDLTNGQSTFVSKYDVSTIGIIYGAAAPFAVPEPSTLCLTTVGLLGLAARAIRRKKS
jgi:hypothetical protein